MSGQRGRKLGHDVMQKTRDKIRATAIVKRLQDHVLGEVEMSATQVRAAEGLLKKILPDLSSVEMKAEIEAAVTEVRKTVVDPKRDYDGPDT